MTISSDAKLVIPAWAETMMRAINERTRRKLSFYDIDQIMKGMRAVIDAEKSELEADCTRSHPHENMNKVCEVRSELAAVVAANAGLMADIVRCSKVSKMLQDHNEKLETENARFQKSLDSSFQGLLAARARHVRAMMECSSLQAENVRFRGTLERINTTAHRAFGVPTVMSHALEIIRGETSGAFNTEEGK